MTHIVHAALILLATREEMHRVWGRFDHERPGISANQIAIAILTVAVVVAATIVRRLSKRRAARTFSTDSAAKLFRDLCAAHGISRSSRRLLQQLAEAHGVGDPATLFVEPRYFDSRKLPVELKASASELQRLCEKLFG
jgi:hypothetical protein